MELRAQSALVSAQSDAMKFRLDDALVTSATAGLEWGQFTCPVCQSGKFLSLGSYRRLYTVDQRSCDKFRRHLLVDHAIGNLDERVRIVEFLRRSAMETSQLRRAVPKDSFANAFPFYASCVLCDRDPQKDADNVIYATSHDIIHHLATIHCIDDAKSIMHVCNASRGFWGAMKVLPKRMEVPIEDEDYSPGSTYCPFCHPKERTFRAGSLELHLFGKHLVRNVRFLDTLIHLRTNPVKRRKSSTVSLFAHLVQEREKPWFFLRSEPYADASVLHAKEVAPEDVISANYDESVDAAIYWYIPELPATLRLMPSHRQLCQNYFANANAITNSLAFLCKACPRDVQPVFEKTSRLSSLLSHMEHFHHIESAYHLLLFSMLKQARVRDLQLTYFVLGHHILDFQAFLNPHASQTYSSKLKKAMPNRTSYCPFCCIFGATSAMPVPFETPFTMAKHLRNDHAFRNVRYSKEMADLLFGKTVHLDVPAELL